MGEVAAVHVAVANPPSQPLVSPRSFAVPVCCGCYNIVVHVYPSYGSCPCLEPGMPGKGNPARSDAPCPTQDAQQPCGSGKRAHGVTWRSNSLKGRLIALKGSRELLRVRGESTWPTRPEQHPSRPGSDQLVKRWWVSNNPNDVHVGRVHRCGAVSHRWLSQSPA